MKHALLAAAAAIAFASTAQAATVTVRPGDASWGNLPDTGSGTINADAPRSGTGSVELVGDRARFANGNFFSPASNLGLLSEVTGLTFDWMIAPDSGRLDYSPSVRLHIWDGGQRSELIYEAAYDSEDLAAGTGANAGNWVTTDTGALFWQFRNGVGPTYIPSTSSYVMNTVADWVGTYSANAYIAAISVGHGSGAGGAYHAFVDNVTIHKTTGSTTYNFEAAVPEPATWAMMIMGFGAVGSVIRRRRGATLAA